jgi:hypothetical protein
MLAEGEPLTGENAMFRLGRIGGASLLLIALMLGTPGPANATLWQAGDLVTYTQGDWGDVPNGSNIASLFDTNYSTVYAPFGVFQVGDLNGYAMFFGSAATVQRYLPSTGPVGALNTDLIDPTSSSSGEFGGDVAAALIDLNFDDAGIIQGTARVHFGDLLLYGLTTTTDYNGLTVRQAIAALESALAGLPTSDTFADLHTLARDLEASFFFGSPSTFAQDHLNAPDTGGGGGGGGGTVSVPEPGTLSLFAAGLIAFGVMRCRVAVQRLR